MRSLFGLAAASAAAGEVLLLPRRPPVEPPHLPRALMELDAEQPQICADFGPAVSLMELRASARNESGIPLTSAATPSTGTSSAQLSQCQALYKKGLSTGFDLDKKAGKLKVTLTTLTPEHYDMSGNNGQAYCSSTCAYDWAHEAPPHWQGACCAGAFTFDGEEISCTETWPESVTCRCYHDDVSRFKHGRWGPSTDEDEDYVCEPVDIPITWEVKPPNAATCVVSDKLPRTLSSDSSGTVQCERKPPSKCKYEVSVATVLGKVDFTVPGRGCDEYGCLEPASTLRDAGYYDEYRGWFDLQGCGHCNDYCRWVGNSGSGGDPSEQLEYGDSWWSCAIAGGHQQYTDRGHFGTWTHQKCAAPRGRAM